MKTTPHTLAALAPTFAGGGTNPTPVVFTSGEERLVVSFVAPAAVNLSYTRPDLSVRLSRPLPVASLEPASAAKRAVVDRMTLSAAIVSAARASILAAQRPNTTTGGLFYDAQRMILVDRFTGDSMDDDDVIILPTEA